MIVTRTEPTPEFSRPVDIGDIGDDGVELDVEASADERRALAKRFDLQAIDLLTACIGVSRIDGGAAIPIIRIDVRFRADVVQTCVVTLESVAAHIEDRAVLDFMPPVGPNPRQVAFSVDAGDPPEPLLGDWVDVGEVVAEHLALALDPYPRKPGAVFDANRDRTERGDDRPGGPFAGLAKLKRGT